MSDPVPVYDRIIAGIVAALGAVRLGANVVRTDRGRTDPVTPDDCPLLILQEDGETSSPVWSGTESHERSLTIEGAVVVAPEPGTDDAATRRKAAQAEADRLAGLLRARVRAVIWTLDADPTALDGLADSLQVVGEAPPQRLTVQTDDPACAFALSVTLAYQTAEGDPFTAA